MEKTRTRNRHEMTGNVQGFELPTGCLMTTGVIAFCVLATAIGAAAADSSTGAILALALPVTLFAAYVLLLQRAHDRRVDIS